MDLPGLDTSPQWDGAVCGLLVADELCPSSLIPEGSLSIYSPFPPAGGSDGLSQFLPHLANCLQCARLYSKPFTNTEPFNPRSSPVRWRLLFVPISQMRKLEHREVKQLAQGHAQPLSGETDTLESVLSSPELYDLVLLLDWPHSIVEPCLCPSATPQGSQGLTLVSQGKVRGRWEWVLSADTQMWLPTQNWLHLAGLPTRWPGLQKKLCIQPAGASLLVLLEQVRLLGTCRECRSRAVG